MATGRDSHQCRNIRSRRATDGPHEGARGLPRPRRPSEGGAHEGALVTTVRRYLYEVRAGVA